ncbi:MAG: hypothetical protein J4473_00050 [Candidatus Aenigmarchaeota archaeon]|nr:hypothetical protein [Candidatus Aenigmarchaeota archaeon]
MEKERNEQTANIGSAKKPKMQFDKTKTYTIEESLKILGEHKKNFSQSYDLVFTLKNINLKMPENKISREIVLPHGTGNEIKVGLISNDGDIKEADIKKLEGNPKVIKKIIKQYDFFISDTSLMTMVGKVMGRYLAPTGRMPKPIPPKADPKNIIAMLQKSIRIRIKDSPTIHCIIGKEMMTENQIKENIETVLKEVKAALPKGSEQVKSVYLKKTMSSPVKLAVKW